MMTLRKILRINAISSGITGLCLIVSPDFFSLLFMTPNKYIFFGVGIFLFLFSCAVYFISRQNTIQYNAVRTIVFVDAIWVVCSVGIVTLQMFDLSSLGYLVIGLVAAWVGLMAYLQYNGLRKLTA